MPNVVSSSIGTPIAQINNRESGVSRLSIGFRHLMDWTPNISMRSFNSNLEIYRRYNVTGTDAEGLPGGGFRRAEVALYGGLGTHEHMPEHLKNITQSSGIDSYIQQLEYLVAGGGGSQQSPSELLATRANPDVPTRRWLYGAPRFLSRKFHSAGDAHQDDLEGELKEGAANEHRWYPAKRIYGKLYTRFLRAYGLMEGSEIDNIDSFLDNSDPALQLQGVAMLKGRLKDIAKTPLGGDSAVEELVLERREALEEGGEVVMRGKSKQELLTELTGMGHVIATSHGELGGSEAFDVLFTETQHIPYGNDNPQRTISVKLADITEQDWTEGQHHGRGAAGGGGADLESVGGIMNYYNQNRIPMFNGVQDFIKKFVEENLPAGEALGGQTPLAWGMHRGQDKTLDAWYRRRATQIASDLRNPRTSGAPRAGRGPRERGKPDDLRDIINEQLIQAIVGGAEEDAWVVTMFQGITSVSVDDVAHVLHHMGSANTWYEDVRHDDFYVDEYSQMFKYKQTDGSEWSVVINFRVDTQGHIQDLRDGDVAIIHTAVNDILLAVWRDSRTNGGLGLSENEIMEARQLFETASGLQAFAGYYAEETAVAATLYGGGELFTARVDHAVPQHMDDLMFYFFHVGNNIMRQQIADLMTDLSQTADSYSSTLRADFVTEMGSRWPTDSWGSRHPQYTGGQSRAVASDFIHSDRFSPPAALSQQDAFNIDFGFGSQASSIAGGPRGQFYPQVGSQTWMHPRETDAQYLARTGHSKSATAAERRQILGIPQGQLPGTGTTNVRRRDPAELGDTDFFQHALEEDPSTRTIVAGQPPPPYTMESTWWHNQSTELQRANTTMGGVSGIWRPGETVGPPPPGARSDLGFVWAAPYVTWQHYQRSGSEEY